MNRSTSISLVFFALVMTSVAYVVTIRLDQEGDQTIYSINNHNITVSTLESVLQRVSSIDSNLFLYIVLGSNVPASSLVATIGLVQRSGLHDLGLVSHGADGTNSGKWVVTVDALKGLIPSCIANENSPSGFIIENTSEFEPLPDKK